MCLCSVSQISSREPSRFHALRFFAQSRSQQIETIGWRSSNISSRQIKLKIRNGDMRSNLYLTVTIHWLSKAVKVCLKLRLKHGERKFQLFCSATIIQLLWNVQKHRNKHTLNVWKNLMFLLMNAVINKTIEFINSWKKRSTEKTDPLREVIGKGEPSKAAKTTERFWPQRRFHTSQSWDLPRVKSALVNGVNSFNS